MRQKILAVMAVCGMCNRLRAIASAIRLAKATNRKLYCIWDPQNNCNIHYNDQFQPDFEIMRSGDWWRKLVLMTHGGATIRSTGLRFAGTRYTSRIAWGPIEVGDEDILLIESGNWFSHRIDDIFINYELQRELYRQHHLRTEVKSGLDNEFANISGGKKVVGVHIRGTDNNQCLSHSPLSVHIAVVDKKLNDVDRILLATDDVAAAGAFRNRYGNRVVLASQPPAERGTVIGMRLAIHDLFLLSKCDIIVGSCGSTYSHAAMCFSNAKVHIAHVPLARGMASSCCFYGYYSYDWLREVVITP